MISATDNWIAATAKLAQKPILLIEIEGYGKAFATSDIGTSKGLPLQGVIQKVSVLVDHGGASLFPSSVAFPQEVTQGDPLFVFVYNASSESTASLSIDDSGVNTWTRLYIDTILVGWSAIANATGSLTVNVSGSTPGFISGGNFEIYAVEVPVRYAGFRIAGAAGSGSLATITAGATTLAFPVNGGSNWNLILVELAPAAGASLPVSLLFARVFLSGVGGAIPGASSIAGGAATAVYAAVGDATVVPWLLNVDPLSETVSDLDGGSDLSDLVFTVQDRAEALTADLAGFTFEGKKVVFKEGYAGLALADYLPRFTGKIENVDSGNANLEYTFTCPDIRKDLSQIIYATGDDGFATSSDHPRTLNGHPLDILVDLLQNEIGWDASIIDIAKIQLWRDTIYSGVQFLFRKITSAPAAKDFIENEIMKPLGAYHRTNNLGVFTVNFFYHISPAPVATLDHGTLTDVPVAQQAALVNQNVFRFDYSDDDKPGAEKVASYKPSLDKYALAGENIIESRGLRSSFGGYAIAAIVSRLIFLRYANKQLQFGGLPNIWSQSLLEPGDIVSVTSSIVPDRELGVLGITAKSFEILDRTWDPMNGIASFKLLAVDLEENTQFNIAPNAEANFTAASAGDKGTYLFLSNDSGEYSDATPANTLC